MEFNIFSPDMNVEQIPEEVLTEQGIDKGDDMIGWCRDLLDKYYEGETTLAEESLLRHYLTTATNLPDDLVAEAAMFGGMAAIAKESTNVELRVVKAQRRQLFMRRARWISAVSAAAVVMLSVGIGLNTQRTYGYINGAPIHDSDMAMEQVMVAMSYLSSAHKQVESNTQSARVPMEQMNDILDMFNMF